MARSAKLKFELSDNENALVERERKVFEVRGEKIRNLRVSAGLSIRMFAIKLTEKTGIIIDRNKVKRWEDSAWVELTEGEMKGVLLVLKK